MTRDFVDLLAVGRLRHARRPKLTDVVWAGTQRPMGGAVGWARRGEQVDGPPLRSATLALWAWTNRPPRVEAPDRVGLTGRAWTISIGGSGFEGFMSCARHY
jgi:hypothetical protein